jgi:hypothetical protein
VTLNAEQMIADSRARRQQRLLQVLEQNCPTCDLETAATAALNRTCRFVGESECKHARELRRRELWREICDRLRGNLRTGCVPRRLWDSIIYGPIVESRAATRGVRRLLDGEGQCAAFMGRVGNGKSTAAALAIAVRGGLFVEGGAAR